MQRVRGGETRRTSGQGVAAKGYADPSIDDDRGISFYKEVPDAELSIREFEDAACDRLKVLHAFDRLCSTGQKSLMQIPELKGTMSTEIHNAHLDLATYAPGKPDEYVTSKAEFMRRDGISHFALRLAFCKTRDAREWFLRQEQRLFVLRFDSLSLPAQEEFLARSGLPCKRFKESEWAGRLTLETLQHATADAKIWKGAGERPDYEQIFYEMPFFEVHPSLIAKRRVVVMQGKAFVPSSALKLILAARFRDHLTAGLEHAFQGMPSVLADKRVGPFLRMLQDHGMQLLVAPKSSSEGPSEKLSLDNFQELLVQSFPPCMRRAVEAQRERKKHLKHAGRLQLRPFLKDCGFTMDESMRWWRQELTVDPEVDSTSFDKNYVYDIEHTYGKKGHFQGQNSFGCPKIIGFPSEAGGQCHGCPFQQLDLPTLKQHLHKWRVPESGVVEIEKYLTHGKHYQLACIEYFKSQHPGNEGDGVGNSPGDYFRESCKHRLKKKEKEAAGKGQGAASQPKPLTAS